ncbi:MAG TPA: helix-turn-helix domain-containing protein [Syntrophales bacterium]|nr:helix-turn-helix domain-containing protein [Syntrophales bacterium]
MMGKDFELGKRIAWLRTNRGMEQKAAAEALGIAYFTYQHYEYGNHPSRKNIDHILNYYKCAKSWLLTGEGFPYPDSPEKKPTELTVESQKDLPPGSFDKFMDEIKRSRELDRTISELIISMRHGGFDAVLFKTIYDVMREFLNMNGREDLNSIDFGIAAIIQTIYRELKRTPNQEELMSLIKSLHELSKIFPHGIPLTPHEQNELFSWGKIQATEGEKT